MENTQKLKKRAVLIAGAIILVILAMVLRGPHVSNALKKLILPELEAATGKRVIASTIYINIFPLFIEAKDLKVFDENGQKLLLAKRVKAYLDLSGLISKTLTIRRLVIKEPLIQADEEQARAIEKSIQEYLAKTRKDALKVKLIAVEIQEGSGAFRSDGLKTAFSVSGLRGEVIIGNVQRIMIDVKTLTAAREGLPKISGGVSARLSMKGDTLTIQRAALDVLGSSIVSSGEYSRDAATVKSTVTILLATVKQLFALEESGDGKIKIDGTVEYAKENVTLDISLAGNFYLETLMELLDVTERLEGMVAVKGTVKGPLHDFAARGTATMTKGNLYQVAIDTLTCEVLYGKGVLSFLNGSGSLYHGSAKASASITLPTVDRFTLDIAFEHADSKPLFGLIGWDPGIPAGSVNGTLHHSGADFAPEGGFDYLSSEEGNDMLGRVKSLTGTYKLEGDRLALAEVTMKTGKSTAVAGGIVDISSETLDLSAVLRTADVSDLASPYVDYLKGAAEFNGKISGTFDDPILSGRSNIADAMIKAYPAGNISADFSYRKNLLQVREMTAGRQPEALTLSGNIAFAGAETLFDLAAPTWGLRAVLKDIDAGDFVKLFYPQFAGSGRFSATARLEGTEKLPAIRAEVSFDKAKFYNVPVDAANFNFRYASSRIDFMDISARQGDSTLRGDFTIYADDTFSYKASSDRIRLSDVIERPLRGEAVARLTSEGKGTFDNPSITLEARMVEGALRGKPIGAGVITAALRNKEFTASAKLISDKVSLSAKGRIDGNIPWEATAEFQTGRYDFLITSVLKDVPEDLILSLNGNVSLHGNREHIAGTAGIKHMVLSMYGYSFTNEEEITLGIEDRELSLGKIALRSGNTLLRTSGSLRLGNSYNVTVEGRSALSPFKSLSVKLGVLKGDADFVVGISGEWEKPKINGGITLTDGSVGLKEYPAYRITDLNGYLYMDNDRVVLQHLSGKVGGGDLDFSGILYLKRFAFSRFYVEAKMKNVTSSVSNDFNVNFGGSLLYKGTPDAQMVSGNIDINKARYRERIEWKSWLLQTKKAETFKADISNLAKADLNIKITGENNIIIDNNVARAVVSTDMVLRGKIYRPSLLGRLETSEGKVFFRNNEFNILHASADFSDPNRLNPFLSIAADTVVKGYKIKMNLEGQLDRFNMSLTSDPPLKEMDILALLTVGQTGSGVKGLEAGIGAGEATSFVTGKMQDVLEERLRSITGLDRFQVDPYVSKTTGTVEPRVTVSKRLLGDKVFVTYTTAVGTLEEQIIKLEFFMSKNVSLVGVRDERGITGGDIRFRFEFK